MHIIVAMIAGGLGWWFAKEDISFAIGYLAYLIVVFEMHRKV